MNEKENNEFSIDINTAASDELTKIPGIGPELAMRIVAARPYQTLDDLQRVSGINTVFIERIAPYVKLTSASPDMGELEVLQAAGESEADDEILAESTEFEVEAEPVEIPMPIEAQELPEEAIPLREEHEVLDEEAVMAQEGVSAHEANVPPEPVSSATPPQAETFTRAQMIWIAVASMFITLILTLLLSLGILAGVNGGRLQFASPAQVNALSVRADGLKSAIDSSTQDLASLRKRVDNLDALSGRISTVEQSVDEIGSSMDAVSAQVDELSQKADGLVSQVETLQQQSDRFTNFFSGLAELMNNLFSSEEGSK
jgi:methyl-accepting chemotaxis protein